MATIDRKKLPYRETNMKTDHENIYPYKIAQLTILKMLKNI
jgi:hypothetical protein